MKTLLSITAFVTMTLSLSPLALAKDAKEAKDHCEKDGKTVRAKDQARCEKKGGKWITAAVESKAPETTDKPAAASQPSQPSQPSQTPPQH